jgi:WD40 repeat protein
MSTYHRLSIAASVVLLLVAGCGDVEPTATPVPPAAAPPTVAPAPALQATADVLPTAAPPTVTPAPALQAAAGVLPITPDNAADLELLRTIEGQQGKVWTVAFSGDGVYLASADRDSINVWEVASGQEAFALGIRELDLNGFTFSPDSRLLATAQTIWDVESQQAVHTLPALGFYVHPAFSPDGAWLAASGGQPIKLLDVASGQVVRTFGAQANNDSFSIVFSPDGTLLADSGHNGRITLWDVASGQVARTLAHGTGNDVHDIAFSPDGELLVSVGTDYMVRLWDVASGQTLHTMGHSDGLYGVAFSPDGSLVASAGCDRTVKLWDVASGRMVSALKHGDEVTSVAFSPDGSLLASGAYDSQVYLWAIPR